MRNPEKAACPKGSGLARRLSIAVREVRRAVNDELLPANGSELYLSRPFPFFAILHYATFNDFKITGLVGLNILKVIIVTRTVYVNKKQAKCYIK